MEAGSWVKKVKPRVFSQYLFDGVWLQAFDGVRPRCPLERLLEPIGKPICQVKGNGQFRLLDALKRDRNGRFCIHPMAWRYIKRLDVRFCPYNKPDYGTIVRMG